MSRKSRKQEVVLQVRSGSIPFMPLGVYEVNITDSGVRGGSIEFKGRVILYAGNEGVKYGNEE